VLSAAAEDLYDMGEPEHAIVAGSRLLERHLDAAVALRQSAWSVVAHSSFDLSLYADAEHAYAELLELIPADDESRQPLFDNLAAAIYKQGEAAGLLEDHRAAADHFLRIKGAAPTSGIRPSAEYDAASALMKLQDWTAAAAVFRDFRDAHAGHELQPDVTKQLAFVYRQAGEPVRSAEEYERVADDTQDPELRREAVLLAGELFEEGADDRALGTFTRYVEEFPRPIDVALETRFKISEIYKAAGDLERYRDELQRIVDIDADAGAERTPRTKYLAARSSLVLTIELYENFTDLALTQPFAESLAEKQSRMDGAMAAFEGLVDYEVAEVTAAATFYMAEIYSHFGLALLDSERPPNLDAVERADYELAIEEEAFPFEERAIDVHEKNLELMTAGTFNGWIEKSLDQLALLMPGRYAKYEISSGFIGPVEVFAYRSPGVDERLETDAEDDYQKVTGNQARDGSTDVSAVF
jgi:tetratricopeptide (TPR) repeat protein